MTTPPTIKPELRRLIMEGLAAQYISESCAGGVETGNHYQSVWLGDEVTTGFRTQRYDLLDRISFDGKTVLDLGSNLGELSRAARAREAALVDGFEYDPFFIELAGLINAYNTVTRVSFYERDITNPVVYRDRYDIVLAFSVFHYVGGVMETIAQMTNELLVVETHRLDGNLETHYIDPVLKFFPAYSILGFPEWRSDDPSAGERAVIAFAKSESALSSCLRSPDIAGRSGA
jgi:SAM-dependent methyltransferase